MNATPSENDPLGYDVFVSDDIAADARDATGEELVRNALRHRLTTEKLLLIGAPNDEVDFGIDVRKWIGERLTPTLARAKGPLVEIVLAREPGVSFVRARVSLAGPVLAQYTLTIAIDATLVTGTVLSLTLGVSAVNVDLLAGGR